MPTPPREEIAEPFKKTAPGVGLSNWGTGVQPKQRTTAELNAPVAAPQVRPLFGDPPPAGRPGRDLGMLNPARSAQLAANQFKGQNLQLMRQNTDPNRAGSGGSITRNGVTTMVPPTAAKSPVPSPVNAMVAGASSPLARTPGAPVTAPTTVGAQQTETANPLTGDTNRNAGGTVAPVNPGRAMGFSRAGSGVPRGQDAAPMAAPAPVASPEQATQQKIGSSMKSTMDNLRGKTAGGTGLYRRTFTNPQSAGMYDGYVKRLFGDALPA